MFKSLLLLALLTVSGPVLALDSYLEKQIQEGVISSEGALLIEEVLMDDLYLQGEGIHVSNETIIDAIYKQSLSRGIIIEGENKSGLMVRNIIRVVVGAIRPSTAGAPTHDGRGRRNSP